MQPVWRNCPNHVLANGLGLLALFAIPCTAAGPADTSASAYASEGIEQASRLAKDKPESQERAAVDKPQRPSARVHASPKPLSDTAMTADWPAFLGPNRDATTPETKLDKSWGTAGPALLWEIETGDGYAAPAVAGDRLIFFHRVGDHEVVDCLHPETGALLWSHQYACTYEDRYDFSGGPRSSPVIGGNRAYTVGVAGMLLCLDLESGKVIWSVDITKRYSVPQNFFGVGSTPLIDAGLLIVQVGAPGGPCIVAFDTDTGKEKWRAGDQWTSSYASPIWATIRGTRKVLVFTGGDSDPPTGGLLVINPSDGAIDVRFGFRSKAYISVNAANPVVVGDRVFLTSSYKTGCVLVDCAAPESGRVVWKSNSLRSHFSTTILRDGYLYGFDGTHKNNTAIVCVNAENGEQVWRELPEWQESTDAKNEPDTEDAKDEPHEKGADGEASPKPAATFGYYRGSLVHADGAFLLLGEDGHLAWVDLSPAGYHERTRTRLFSAPQSWTGPVISHGLLYICQNTPDNEAGTPPRLLCYDLRAR